MEYIEQVVRVMTTGGDMEPSTTEWCHHGEQGVTDGWLQCRYWKRCQALAWCSIYVFFLNRGRSNMSSSTDYVCEMVVWEFQTPLGWRCWCWPCSLSNRGFFIRSGEVRRGTESKGPLGCCFQTTQWQYSTGKLQRAKWMRPELSWTYVRELRFLNIFQ